MKVDTGDVQTSVQVACNYTGCFNSCDIVTTKLDDQARAALNGASNSLTAILRSISANQFTYDSDYKWLENCMENSRDGSK